MFRIEEEQIERWEQLFQLLSIWRRSQSKKVAAFTIAGHFYFFLAMGWTSIVDSFCQNL